MKRRAQVSRLADAEIDEIVLSIESDNPAAAARFLAAAQNAFNMLAQNPALGTHYQSPRLRLRDLRFWPIHGFENYLIFYRPTDAGIYVVHVLHGARDVRHILSED